MNNITNCINNFKAYDNKSSLSIIKNLGSEEVLDKNDKRLFVIAGPNGSGKTTLIANMYKLGKLDVPYLNADLFASTLYSFISDEKDRNLKSMYYTMEKVEKFINIGKSFCYETVLSHPSKLELIKLAKEKEYEITSIFVYTNSPEINIERVAKRVEQGGHDVPKNKIVERYYRSLEFSKRLQELSNKFYIFDNSKDLNSMNAEVNKWNIDI